MAAAPRDLERELFGEFAAGLTAAVGAMANSQPNVSWDPLPSPPVNPALRWRQPLSELPGAVWILASEPDTIAAGQMVLKTVGIKDADPGECKSTCQEIYGQALAVVSRWITARFGREAAPGAGDEPADVPAGGCWAEVQVKLGEDSFVVAVGFDDDFVSALPDSAPVAAAVPAPSPKIAAAAPVALPQNSKTFDLLLDVELSVSVSFGRAQIPLKDVLKLNTGAIVELNRSVVEPVEIIVNNCVIARGEVVVVEGNFGVRIQQVVSRQERLRTFQ